MQLNVILADDLLPLKNHRSLAVSQLSGCLINLQVKCICSATHPPRSWLCWYDTGYSVWAGQENGSLKEERGWESRPVTTYKEPSIASVTATYTVFLQNAYQLRFPNYNHSLSVFQKHNRWPSSGIAMQLSLFLNKPMLLQVRKIWLLHHMCT